MIVFIFILNFQVFSYSLEHEIPLVAFCGDRCLTLFDHPLVNSLHDVYCEPKVSGCAINFCVDQTTPHPATPTALPQNKKRAEIFCYIKKLCVGEAFVVN